MKHQNTPLAQTLRRNQTKEEARLWYQFLRRYPLQFRRQVPLGPYIVDFYCSKAKLVIELDGSQHYEPQVMEYDNQRTRYLEDLGLTILRFTNREIALFFPNVCECIDREVRTRYPIVL